MAWKLDSDRPIYTQILEVIIIRIITGQYGSGDKLPSVRELAAEAGVNPNTMQKAMAELERSGLVTTQRTSGRTVTEDRELVQQMQKDLAMKQVSEFVYKMEKLGFDKKGVEELLSKLDWTEIQATITMRSSSAPPPSAASLTSSRF